MSNIEILIISNKHDYTTDYVCVELEKRGCCYLRLNRDCFDEYKLTFTLETLSLSCEIDECCFFISDKYLKAIYFRAPVFTREFTNKIISVEEQLYKSQWNSFIRNLALFENIIWMNNPIATYKAENKMLQLKYAKAVGFNVPFTFVTNDNEIKIDDNKQYAIKSLDTAHFVKESTELFVYTNIVDGKSVKEHSICYYFLSQSKHT